jgi:uncharacterized protein YutE (UPF0331/DUF86 family)
MGGINLDAVEFRIREINDALQLLRDLLSKSFEELSIYERLSVRYLVIQLVEAAASICTHLLLRMYDETPGGFPECFGRLGDKGVLPSDLASRLASAARLRNLLVHRYWVVEDEKVYESVRGGLRDFEDFVRYIREVLKG